MPIELGDEWGIDLNANLNSLLVRCLDSTMENGVDANVRGWRNDEGEGFVSCEGVWGNARNARGRSSLHWRVKKRIEIGGWLKSKMERAGMKSILRIENEWQLAARRKEENSLRWGGIESRMKIVGENSKSNANGDLKRVLYWILFTRYLTSHAINQRLKWIDSMT